MAETTPEYIAVQVCYAGLEATSLLLLTVPAEANVKEVLERSGIAARHPEIDINVCKLGVFGKLKTLESPLHDGDRVEIYRPLIADPMEARRRRAKKQR